jgi:hypothetical protein
MNTDTVRDSLRKACEDAGCAADWAKANEISAAYVSDVLNGRKEPGEKILRALGLKRVVEYRRAAS